MTTLEALMRREANPPLKSPLPQHTEAAKPKSTVAMMPVMGFRWSVQSRRFGSGLKILRTATAAVACRSGENVTAEQARREKSMDG